MKDVGSVELGQIAAKAALDQAKLTPEQIDSVIVGNIIQVINPGLMTWLIHLFYRIHKRMAHTSRDMLLLELGLVWKHLA